MKFRLAVLGLLALLFALPDCCSYRGPSDPRIESRAAYVDKLVHETVALVMFVDDDGDEVSPDVKDAEMKPYCAGVWVSKDTFLTAYHCIEDLRPDGAPSVDEAEKQVYRLLGVPMPGTPMGGHAYYSVRDDVNDAPRKRMYRDAKVVGIDMDHDLALVRDLNSAPQHPLATLASDVKEGEELDIVGMPARSWWAYTHGWAQNILPTFELGSKDKLVKMIQIQAPIWYGDSGGPAFNAAGQLVGISSRLATRVPERGFYVHLDHLDAFLRSNGLR